MSSTQVMGATALLALALAPPLLAQQGQGRIEGRVIEAGGVPQARATVVLVTTGARAETDASGRFVFTRVPNGRHELRATRLGFSPVMQVVEVSAGATISVQIEMQVASLALEPLTVTAIGSEIELNEVRQRLREIPGSVELIEPEELRSTRQANFKDILRFTPGVHVQPRFGAADESQLSIRGSGLRNNFHLRGVNVLVNACRTVMRTGSRISSRSSS